MERLCEIYRYMGIKDEASVSDALKNKTNELLLLAKTLADFKYVYKVFDFTQSDTYLDFGFLKTGSESLKKCLLSSSRAIVFVLTVGMEFEKKLQLLSKTEPLDALVLGAIGTELLESFADDLTENTFSLILKEGESFTPRFSPGYGDFSLLCQKDIFNFLKPEKNAGIYLTESNMMIPSKSITAIVGITKEKKEYKNLNCIYCDKKDCTLRKGEKN